MDISGRVIALGIGLPANGRPVRPEPAGPGRHGSEQFQRARDRRAGCEGAAAGTGNTAAMKASCSRCRSGVTTSSICLTRSSSLTGAWNGSSTWPQIGQAHLRRRARSLAGWGLLIAASGVQYDGIARTLSFDPIADGRYPFTTGTAWGVATIASDDVTLGVPGGRLDLASLSLRGRSSRRSA